MSLPRGTTDMSGRVKRSTAKAQAVGRHMSTQVTSGKEVMSMPITITIHVFGFTITVRVKNTGDVKNEGRVKSNNRHSAK